MKAEHEQILDKIKVYLSQPGAEHLRFWQALYNMDIVVFEDNMNKEGTYSIKDDHNISDQKLIDRIKEWPENS